MEKDDKKLKAAERAERLAENLRNNLRRRKAQARESGPNKTAK